MKNDYLDRLSKALNYYAVPNKKEILEKYKKRYEFGLESEMSEEEIEELLGDPMQVAEKLSPKPMDDKPKDNKKEEVCGSTPSKYNLTVKSIADDIEIGYSKDGKFHAYGEDVDMDGYVFSNNQHGLSIVYKKRKYFTTNHKSGGTLCIDIPKNITLDSVVITNNSGDIKSISFQSKSFDCNTISGNVLLDLVKSDKITIHSVSGQYKINAFKGKNCSISSVSGDIEIGSLYAERITIDTVSGDVKVNDSFGRVSSSSVTGKITVNGCENKNMTKKIKEIFK